MLARELSRLSTQDGYVGRDGSDDDGATIGGYIRQVKFDGLEMLVCGGSCLC